MRGDVVPVLSALAVLLTALAGLLGVFVTRAAGRRTGSAEDLRMLLEERRADRADDRAEIDRLEQELRMSRALEQALREQLRDCGYHPHDEPR